MKIFEKFMKAKQTKNYDKPFATQILNTGPKILPPTHVDTKEEPINNEVNYNEVKFKEVTFNNYKEFNTYAILLDRKGMKKMI